MPTFSTLPLWVEFSGIRAPHIDIGIHRNVRDYDVCALLDPEVRHHLAITRYHRVLERYDIVLSRITTGPWRGWIQTESEDSEP